MLKALFVFCVIILTIHCIILIHELGHYVAAKIFNIKVKTFSIGLGKTIWQRTDKNATSWRLGLFPIGGYVVVLNSQVDDVKPREYHQTFNIKPLWQKIVVYLAGPIANIICALVIYFFLYLNGLYQVKPYIADIIPDSIASNAGIQENSLITKINDIDTKSWRDASLILISQLGSNNILEVETKKQGQKFSYKLDIREWHLDSLKFNPIASIGFKPYLPNTPAVIADIIPNSPADGVLSIGDKIIAINDIKITNFSDYTDAMHYLANKEIKLMVNSSNITKIVPITTSWTLKDGWEIAGYLGIKPEYSPWPKDKLVNMKYSVLGSLSASIDSTVTMLSYNFIILSKLIQRIIPMASLSGPIGFVGVAISSLNSSLKVFLEVIAIFNILLAFANILPLPGLDGGNILFRVYEAIKGQEISYMWQELITTFSIIFLVVITIHATINDVLRLLT
ncbi:MAG: RIP metalloprotease RseP [Pseudomonadota bacterium]|nr:RIP metalloprotease RseP [Pseudomonadota bacterium]